MPSLVVPKDAPVRPSQPGHLGNGVRHRAEPFFTFTQCFFGLPALGDVPCYFRSPDDVSVPVSNRRYGHGNVHVGPILAHANRIIVWNRFPLSNAR